MQANMNYDPLHTMLALNMAVVSVNRILNTEDRVVLTQEYDNIINNLKLGSIEADSEMTELYTKLMDAVGRKALRRDDAAGLRSAGDERGRNRILEAVKGAGEFDGSIVGWLGKFAVSCASQYFSAADEEGDKLSTEVRRLNREELDDCREIQKTLLNSSWGLLRQYGLPDEYRLVQSALDDLFRAIDDPDAGKSLRMLRRMEKEFGAYPPYWVYRARAASGTGDEAEASSCLDKFDDVWRPVLRQDPFMLEAARSRISARTSGGVLSDDDVRDISALLDVLREHAPRGDWQTNVFAAMTYFALDRKDDAEDCLEANMDFGYETEASAALLAQMRDENSEMSKKLAAARKERETVNASAGEVSAHTDGGSSDISAVQLDAEDEAALADLPPDVIEIYRKAAAGDEAAVFKFVDVLDSGVVNLDGDTVRRMFVKLAARGSAWAIVLLIWSYSDDASPDKDASEAAKWAVRLCELADGGNALAMASCIVLHKNPKEPLGDAADDAKIDKWKPALRGLFEKFDADVMRLIDDANAREIFGSVLPLIFTDKSDLAEWCRSAVEKGHYGAAYVPAEMYRWGNQVEKDIDEATKWYRLAAERGDAVAQKTLGDIYQNDKKDIDEAVKWYRLAAEQGDADAQRALGDIYQNDKKDTDEAMKWYRLAAEHGDVELQRKLGDIYRNDKKDVDEAVKWYRLAAEHGKSPVAGCQLGGMYKYGIGVTKDIDEAIKWYRLAAEHGDGTKAPFELGDIYRDYKKDIDEAIKWYRLAANQGFKVAKDRLKELGVEV